MNETEASEKNATIQKTHETITGEMNTDIKDECPHGGDTENDCADCIYRGDYHLVNGECITRDD